MEQLMISKTIDADQNKDQIKEEKENNDNQIGEDFYYDENNLEKRKKISVIDDNICKFNSIYGFDSEKRNNFKFINKQNIIYSSGVTYTIMDVEKKKQKVFHSRDGGGVGCIAVHGDNDYIAIGEKGDWPNIYIYDFPDLNLYRILKKGAEKSYSNIVFSIDGNTMASVGNNPDYLLIIWDWRKQQMMLKAKAFSQEVYRIEFSLYQADVLATMGTGHIKFWKIAETFTGLKLKGQIAKFGTQEISDVITCYHFSDGKILSSTEYGNLLLWEGNLIKCVIGKSETEGIHTAAVEAILKQDEYIVTAGRDGYIRYWSHSEIDNCEPDDSLNYFPTMLVQIYISGHIVDIQRFQETWMLYDKKGKLYIFNDLNSLMTQTIKENQQKEQQTIILNKQFKEKQDQYKKQIEQLQQDSSNQEVSTDIINQSSANIVQEYQQQLDLLKIVRDVDISQVNITFTMDLNNGKIVGNYLSDNIMMSLSEDSKVFVTDIEQQQQICIRHLDQQQHTKGTAMALKPNTQLECATGFSNGILRIVIIDKEKEDEHKIKVIKSYKVFDNAVQFIQFNNTGETLILISQKGEIFIFDNYMPYCLFESNLKINSVNFNNLGNKFLMGLNDGRVVEIKIPKVDQCDVSETYLKEMDILRQQTIKMMEFQKPKVEDMDIDFFIKKKNEKVSDPKKEEWEAVGINSAIYYDQDSKYCLVSVDGKFSGYLYIMDFISERPIKAIQINKMVISYMSLDFKSNILYIGSQEGKVQLRHKENTEDNWLQLECHDQDYGRVNQVQLNNEKTAIISSSNDGTIIVHHIDYSTLQNQFKGMDYVDSYKYPPLTSSTIKSQSISQQEQDTQDTNQYSIQQAKLLLNEDLQRKEAEKKKDQLRHQINALRQRFQQINSINSKKSQVLQLTEDQIEVDQEFQYNYQQRMNDQIEECKKVLEYDIQFNNIRTQKIKKYFIDELVIDKFAVKVIRNPKIQVKTFKLQKMSQYLSDNLEQNYKEIEEQQLENNEQIENNKEGQQQSIKVQDKDKYDFDLDELENAYDKELEEKGFKDGAQKRKEKRKMLEQAINKALEDLKKEQPTKEAFDPDHKKEIAQAYAKFGDYKLKNDKQYVVPENQTMNVSKKRKHLFLLEEFIYNSKLKFNNEVINLREMKKFISQKVKDNNHRIQQINKELGIEEELFYISFDKDVEYPESKLEIENLIEDSQDQIQTQTNIQSNQNDKPQKQKINHKKINISSNIKNRKGYKIEKSELEIMNDKIKEIQLKAEKKKLKDEMDQLIDVFDRDIIKLANEKNIIEGDLMVAKMKLVTFYQELLILEDMEEKDNSLLEELIKLRKEKQQLEEQTIQIINNLLGIKETEVKIEKVLSDLMKQFKELIHPDDDIARNKIHEHYRKQFKMKKAKQIKQLNEDEDELNEEEEEEEDENYDQDDDEDKPDTTPIESDPKSKDILESIVQNEDEQETNKKNRQDLEASKKQINSKTNQLMIRLEATENELKDYQRIKLQKLNKIDISVVINLNQIQNLVPYRKSYIAPDDLSSSILFTNQELDNLNLRIIQLQQEKKKIDQNKKYLSNKKKNIDKEYKIIQNEYLKQEKDYEEKHMLKFGYIMDKDQMDLKFLEAFEPTKQLLEMRQKYKKEENLSIKKIEEAQNKLVETKKQLLMAKKENTFIISSITELGKQQIALDKKLNSTNNKLFKEHNENQKKNSERDKANLKELVKFLNKLIEDLKAEIGIFKRKGGHIYTLVNNNQRQ